MSNLYCLICLNIRMSLIRRKNYLKKTYNDIFDPHKFNDKDDFNVYNSNSDYYDNEQLKEVANIEKNNFSLLKGSQLGTFCP